MSKAHLKQDTGRAMADTQDYGAVSAPGTLRLERVLPRPIERITWGESRGGESEGTFELTPRGTDVFLVVTHRGLVSRDEMIRVAAGWHAHIGILIDRLEGRAPQGFWAVHTGLEAEYERRLPR